MTSHVYLLFSIGINYHSPCSYFSQSIPLYYHTIPMGKTHSIPKNFSIIPFISGWWFGTFGFFCHVLGISSSQLTNSIIFQRGRYTTNQIWSIAPLKDDVPVVTLGRRRFFELHQGGPGRFRGRDRELKQRRRGGTHPQWPLHFFLLPELYQTPGFGQFLSAYFSSWHVGHGACC